MSELNRIDNLFINARDVAKLAAYYNATFGLPIRREQILKPGLMWVEILVGGMELSFRLYAGTPKQHPDLKKDFLELTPGQGATISFEVTNTPEVRAELSRRGVVFRGPTIPCTNGKELISIFEDFEGRPVQLYEGKFTSAEDAFSAAKRGSSTMPSQQIGANIRDVRSCALSVTFLTKQLDEVKRFYGQCLGLPMAENSKDIVIFQLDGSVIEFRNSLGSLRPDTTLKGGIPMIEVRDISYAGKYLKEAQVPFKRFVNAVSTSISNGPRLLLQDLEGNFVQLWERH
jgi:catechol 2,3-dioxygenase-like lactoylglutathione lyase family enzyme